MNPWPENDRDRADYEDWQHDVSNGDTVLGFRDWVAHREEANGEPGGQHPYAGAATREQNCTAGLMCPQCGATGTFTVVNALVSCTLSDDGVDEYEGCEYGPEARMECGQCPHRGSVADFTLPEGPTWTDGPVVGEVRATVPSEDHEDRVLITVSADGRWVVEGLDGRLDLFMWGRADDSVSGRAAALSAWRAGTVHTS